VLRTLSPGSFGALLGDYFADAVLQNKAPSTKKIYRLILEPIGEKYGALPVAQLERDKIKERFAARADTPGMANMFIKVLRHCSSTQSKRAIAATIRRAISPCGSWVSIAHGKTMMRQVRGPLASRYDAS